MVNRLLRPCTCTPSTGSESALCDDLAAAGALCEVEPSCACLALTQGSLFDGWEVLAIALVCLNQQVSYSGGLIFRANYTGPLIIGPLITTL